MSSSLRISIALCTFNGAAYLSNQLRSILDQTRKPDEVVIFDDNSTDDTVPIIRRFAVAAGLSVSVSMNPRTIGPAENFALAIAACSGDVIALCDQDDIWLPRKLELIEAEFVKNPNLGVVFTDAEICDENAEPLGYRLWKSIGLTPSYQTQLLRGKAFEVILRQNVVTGATMAFSSRFKSLLLPIGSGWMHDGWIALLVSAIAPVAIINKPLIQYRQHPQQSVGALRRTLYQQFLNARKMDRQVFQDHADMYQSAYDHLRALAGHIPLRPEVLPMLEEKIQHYRTRSAIRTRRTNRIVASIKELLTLRYQRYSMGWKSFAQDVFL